MKFKKIIAVAAVLSMFTGIVVNAEKKVTINDISVNDGVVTVIAECDSLIESELALRAVKNDERLSEADRFYAVLQMPKDESNKVKFEFYIPDEKGGISSSGDYNISVTAGEGASVSRVLSYLSEQDLESFIIGIKTADSKVKGKDKEDIINSAAELILPYLSEQYATELLNSGINIEKFNEQPQSVKNETVYLMHTDGLSNISVYTLKTVYNNALSVAIYNSGECTVALESYKPELSDTQIKAILEFMDSDYDSIDDFEEDYELAYVLNNINNARVEIIEEELSKITQSSELTRVVSKIQKLNSSKKNKAYEYIIQSIDKSPVKNIDELIEITEKAYDSINSTGTGTSSGGGGGGGGRGGRGGVTSSPDNGSVPSSYSVTTPVTAEPELIQTFSDVPPSHWASESIEWLSDNNIVNGSSYGIFEPDRNVTREEFVKMIVLACNIDLGGGVNTFADIRDDAWYAFYISAAVKNNIINGISETMFGVGQNITREDMAVISARALRYAKITVAEERAYSGFKDEAEISSYAYDDVTVLYKCGIINGRGNDTFVPKGTATRAEAAKIIYEIFGGNER